MKKAKKKNRLFRYIKESRTELKKVSWPTGKELLKNVSIVLTVVTVSTLFVWGVDLTLQSLLNLVISNF